MRNYERDISHLCLINRFSSKFISNEKAMWDIIVWWYIFLAKRTLAHLNVTAPLLQQRLACFAALPSYRAINNRDWFCDLQFRASRPQNGLSCEHVSFLIRFLFDVSSNEYCYTLFAYLFAKNDEVSFVEFRWNSFKSSLVNFLRFH